MARPTNKPSFLAIGAASLLGLSFPARAAETAHVQVVRYGDLNLSTPSGSQELRKRLQRAAGNVCAELVHGMHDMHSASRYLACRAMALDAALRALPTETASVVRIQVPRARETPRPSAPP